MAFSSAFKSFWHAMTSNDRHSNYNSPYRTGQHVPLNQDRRMSTLASVATASDSRHDVSYPYANDETHLTSAVSPSIPQRGLGSAGFSPMSPSHPPYSPGARSESAKRHSNQMNRANDGFDVSSPAGEIPMQSFQDGLPPPPSLSHSWRRIDSWAEENYPELYDQLCEGCTTNDLNELEHMLDCSLPTDVRDSLQIHDGQERGGNPTGIIFGSMLLDCEEIVQEWDQWRRVNAEYLSSAAAAAAAENAARAARAAEAAAAAAAAAAASEASGTAGGSSATASASASVHSEGSDEASSSKAPSVAPVRSMWRQELQKRQDCVPPNSVQKHYAHPAWIPLVRDWGGNNLAIDLAPGPAGTWGQVIMFGRDYDTKYVVARSWAAFVALVADDLNSGKWFIDEDNNELKLREFKSSRVEPSYFDILRWRADQKYGRRGPNRRKSVVPGAPGSPTASVSGSASGSPYASPVDAVPSSVEPRGRPLQRLSSPSPLASPNRPGYGKSPLSRVTEEASLAESITAAVSSSPVAKTSEKLVELETPRVSSDGNPLKVVTGGTPKKNSPPASIKTKMNGTSEKMGIAHDETMKTIEI